MMKFKVSGDVLLSRIDRFNEDKHRLLKLEALKTLRFKYNPDTQVWAGHISQIMGLKNYLNTNAGITDTPSHQAYDFIMNEYRGQTSEICKTMPTGLYFKHELLDVPPLYNEQEYAVRHCVEFKRGFIRFDAGLGKTYIACNALYQHFQRDGAKALIVLPASSKINFLYELNVRFLSRMPKPLSVCTSTDVFEKKGWAFSSDIVVLTYHELRNYIKKQLDGSIVNKKKSPIDLSKWGKHRILMLDESHYVKNKTSQISSAVRLLHEFFDYRYFFSGTPMNNHEADVYEQIRLLDKRLMPLSESLWKLNVNDYQPPFTYIINKSAFNDEMARLSPFLKSATKEVLHLEKPLFVPYHLPMDDKQKTLYREITEASLSQYEGVNILSSLVVSKLLCENYDLVKNTPAKDKLPVMLQHKISSLPSESESPKMQALMEIVDEYAETRNKMLIWSYHPATIDMIVSKLREKGYPCIGMHGGMYEKGKTKAECLSDMRDTFMSDRCRILVASGHICNDSLNLQFCDTSIYYDRDYSSIFREQSIGRIYRAGQKNGCTIIDLIYENTMDVSILAMLKNKIELQKVLSDSTSVENIKKFVKGDDIV